MARQIIQRPLAKILYAGLILGSYALAGALMTTLFDGARDSFGPATIAFLTVSWGTAGAYLSCTIAACLIGILEGTGAPKRDDADQTPASAIDQQESSIEPAVLPSPTGLGMTYSRQAHRLALAAHDLPPGSPERRAAMRRVAQIQVVQGRDLARRATANPPPPTGRRAP
mgnify:CR=1 FL=1